MKWTVLLDPAFEPEFVALPEPVQDERFSAHMARVDRQ
jgi:hypothetical protein